MKRALVLCGGGSLGSYEIGAWRKIREKGLKFDIITGASIGAINGAMVVMDDYPTALAMWEKINTDEVMRYGIDLDRSFWDEVDFHKGSRFQKFLGTYLKKNGVDNTPFRDLMSHTIDCQKVVSSPIKFGCIATEFPSTKETRFLISGSKPSQVIPYLMASSACFPIFPKYKLNGRLYIDGGWRNNLPIDYALELGADEVIAVILHSFPPMPQKPQYYKELPNVTVIEPSLPQGSIMSFKQEAIHFNMELGYLDAGKALGDYRGYAFAFSKEEDISEKAHAFFQGLIGLGITVYIEAKKILKWQGKEPESEEALYLRNLERIALLYNINGIKLYSVNELEETIRQAILAFKQPVRKRKQKFTAAELEKWDLLEEASNYAPPKPIDRTKKVLQILDILTAQHLFKK
jgi:NTE family protein